MRDTGCEGVVVRKQLVDTSQLTGEYCLLLRIENTALLAEKAVISLRTPFLSGEVKALCIPDAICDVIVGNVEGARSPEDPDMSVRVGAATTRAQAKREAVTKPLRVPGIERHAGVGREQLIKLQQEDPRILALVDAGRTLRRGGKVVSFEKARGIVYWRYEDLGRNVDVKQRVAIDLVGPLNPPSEAGHRLILTLVDYATRFDEAVPLRKIDTECVAEALVDIYSRLGVPEEVLREQGTQFISDCMKEVCRFLGIKRKTTSPYHPMCNGLVERFNATLKTCLRRLCIEQPRQWHRYINPLLFAYRKVPQESTHFAPFELLYGRTVRGPMHILRELWTKEIEEPDVKSSYEYVLNLRERLDDTLKIAREELEKAQGRHKHYYDRTSKRRKFSVGEKVLVLLPTDSNKLLIQWKGPFDIVATVGINDYRINMGGKEKTFRANLLKGYITRDQDASQATTDKRPPTSSSAIPAASVTVIEDLEGEHFNDCDCEALPELGWWGSEETVNDLKYGNELTLDQRKQLEEVAVTYSSIFSDRPGTALTEALCIELTSSIFVRQRPYPVPYAMRQTLRDELREMEDLGVIRKSSSPYASPVVVVKTKDGTNRVCIDYRRLNKLTIFDPQPMTPPADIFQDMEKGQCFSKIDLSKGYWQIPVRKEDIPKTAFVTMDCHYEFLRMMNSGATLTRAVKKLLCGMDNVVDYMDDLLIHTETWEAHVKTLKELFKRHQEANFTARPVRCLLGSRTVDSLGHSLGRGAIGLQDKNVEKVRNAPRPKRKREVRAFLGLVGNYKEFVPNFAAVSAPLPDLVRKGQPNVVNWGDSQERAFNSLKVAVTSKSVLQLPELTKSSSSERAHLIADWALLSCRRMRVPYSR
ncbi:Zinc finger protein [Plakobranchus ocellatus]|uniref:Zinc finger protein n=1 Tax=Plakobranchus ocellatus TaxID=259542 RepID=A0AAV4CQ52_9GAST|nr:Zinc finger protein [Plakobranchus ocellatus]